MVPSSENGKAREKLNQRVDLLNLILSYLPSAMCKICWTNQVNTALVPCGHCLCDECLMRLQKFECPYCRTEHDYALRIFLADN